MKTLIIIATTAMIIWISVHCLCDGMTSMNKIVEKQNQTIQIEE